MKTAPGKKTPPMCPACRTGGAPFEPRRHSVEQEFRGETFKVKSPTMACRNCGFEILGEGQIDTLRERTEAAFRKKHKLLAPQEIIARRTTLGMSQKQFAAFLDVGIASVKRWETGYVQDPQSDRRIREKTEPERADGFERTVRKVFAHPRKRAGRSSHAKVSTPWDNLLTASAVARAHVFLIEDCARRPIINAKQIRVIIERGSFSGFTETPAQKPGRSVASKGIEYRKFRQISPAKTHAFLSVGAEEEEFEYAF